MAYVLLPELSDKFVMLFLFVLAIIFGSLRYARIFGNNSAVQMIIALALAYFACTYEPFANVLYANLSLILWFFVIMFFVIFVREAVGIGKGGGDHKTNAYIYAGLMLVLITVGIRILGLLDISSIPFFGSVENLALFLGVLLIIGLFYAVHKSEGG